MLHSEYCISNINMESGQQEPNHTPKKRQRENRILYSLDKHWKQQLELEIKQGRKIPGNCSLSPPEPAGSRSLSVHVALPADTVGLAANLAETRKF